MLIGRRIYSELHEMFRDTARRFLRQELETNIDSWEKEGVIPREFWRRGGEQGLLCPSVPEEYGGAGGDTLFDMVLSEELGYAIGGASVGFASHTDICSHYLLNYGTEEQKKNYLPKMVTGETIAAIGMTEPGAGSDLKAISTTAKKNGDTYIVNGQKTYITNGQNADLIILACTMNKSKGAKGISLLLVDADSPGFSRGRNLDKIGQKAADTSELFFDNVEVPVSNLLGEEGKGFAVMMEELPRERMSVAVRAVAASTRAYELTCEYVKDREIFGQKIWDFQNTKFKLVDVLMQLNVTWAYVDQCIERLNDGSLTVEEGAIAKVWASEVDSRVVDECLQLFGGYGYMSEYPIARFYTDSRVRRIFGGTSETLRSYISRSI